MINRQLDTTGMRNIPGRWARWKHVPDVGTLVHILAIAHLSYSDEFAPLPGGLFAIITRVDSLSEGHVRIATCPASVYKMRRYSRWSWDHPFPFHLRGEPSTNGIRLEVVPEDVADAVRATLALDGWNLDTYMPIAVDDGWLT